MFSHRELLVLLICPLLVLSQNSTDATSGTTPQTITTTLLSTSVGLGPGRQTTTVVFSSVVTTVISPTPTGNVSSTNSTTTNSTSSASSTAPKNLPTAPTTVDGGGGGGAPSPGASSANGVYGPNDGYIAAATTLARNSIIASVITAAIGGMLLVF